MRALGGDVLPGQHLQRAAGVAHVEGGHEGARAIEIAGARHGVDLGHQGAGGGARLAVFAWQRHLALNQPDDVAGEQGHLLGRQGHAGAQLLGSGEAGACVHQDKVLLFVAAVAGEEAVAGAINWNLTHISFWKLISGSLVVGLKIHG